MSQATDTLRPNVDPLSATHGGVSHAWKLCFSERKLLLLTGDLVFLGVSLLLALWLRHTALGLAFPSDIYPHWWLVLWALWIPLSVAFASYDLKQASKPINSALSAVNRVGIVCSLYLVLPIVSAPLTRSRLAWFYFVGIAMLSVGVWRVAYAKLLWQPTFLRRALLVGAGQAGRSFIERLNDIGSSSGTILVGCVDDDKRLQGQDIHGFRLLGDSKDLCDLVTLLEVDEIILAITDLSTICESLMRALVTCWEHGTVIRPMPLYYEEIADAVPIQHIGPNLFALAGPRHNFAQRIWCGARRLIDLLVGLAGLAMLAPLVPIIALASYLDCPGTPFYCQERVGQAGKRFRICKFRSMIPNAERNGVQWAKADDERITRVGRFLRKTRIDELPQLWNLLKGDMTLIGPRPERPEFVQELRKRVPYYSIRHSIKPGLTGWAQVRYPYGNSYHDSMMKLQYDLYYIKHQGPILNLSIILRTIGVVLKMQGT